MTARWVVDEVAPARDLRVTWQPISLFEKNQPASFKQPLYSLMGDWKMFWQILTGRIAF